jgi:hypothetical protein
MKLQIPRNHQVSRRTALFTLISASHGEEHEDGGLLRHCACSLVQAEQRFRMIIASINKAIGFPS